MPLIGTSSLQLLSKMEVKRRRLQYTSENLKKAVEAVQAGMPFKTASSIRVRRGGYFFF